MWSEGPPRCSCILGFTLFFYHFFLNLMTLITRLTPSHVTIMLCTTLCHLPLFLIFILVFSLFRVHRLFFLLWIWLYATLQSPRKSKTSSQQEPLPRQVHIRGFYEWRQQYRVKVYCDYMPFLRLLRLVEIFEVMRNSTGFKAKCCDLHLENKPPTHTTPFSINDCVGGY